MYGNRKLLNSNGYLAWGEDFNEKVCYESSNAKTIDKKRNLLKSEFQINQSMKL